MKYTLWVDLGAKVLSLSEQQGYARYDYPSEAVLSRVIRMLQSDGYRLNTGYTPATAV